MAKIFQYYTNVSLSRTMLAGQLFPIVLYFAACTCMVSPLTLCRFSMGSFGGIFFLLLMGLKQGPDLRCIWFSPVISAGPG